MNILKDTEFTSANKIFSARCKLYFKAGNPKPKHKPCIGEGDMMKLSEYFRKWETDPHVLVEATWFHLCFYFGRRGREGWTSMMKDTFEFGTDDEGHEYVAFSKTESTKNYQGGHKQKDMDYSDQRMYGPGVSILKFYLSKTHPMNHRLFQHPLVSYKLLEDVWFRNEPIGKNTLSNMMQRISSKAGLSMQYTCHSVRASTISILYRAGIPTQSIINITKHKNEASLSHYISGLSNAQKRECSSVLTDAFTTHSRPTSSSSPQPGTSNAEHATTWDLSMESEVQGDSEQVRMVFEKNIYTDKRMIICFVSIHYLCSFQ